MKHSSLLLQTLIAGAVLCTSTILLAQSNNDSSAPGSATASSSDATSKAKQHSSGMAASDKKFVREAAQGGMAEVELGKLATEKASGEDVKKFGQRMVDDHSKANDELKQLASSKGIDLPRDLSAKDKKLKERLSKLSGADFDKAYMQSMVKDHKQDVAEFTRESSKGADSDVQQFAAKTLPTLKDHLRTKALLGK